MFKKPSKTPLELCNILTYISCINTLASGNSPLAQLVKELDLCSFLCVLQRLWDQDQVEPIHNVSIQHSCNTINILEGEWGEG